MLRRCALAVRNLIKQYPGRSAWATWVPSTLDAIADRSDDELDYRAMWEREKGRADRYARVLKAVMDTADVDDDGQPCRRR